MAASAQKKLLDILRLFELAGEMTSKQAIRYKKQTEYRPGCTMYEFVYDRNLYIVMIDKNAADDTTYLADELKSIYPDTKGDFVKNPKDKSGYGMPYKGKDVYLFAVKATHDRLDSELKRRFPMISRSTLQKYIKEGYVNVKGEKITLSSAKVTPYDDITLSIPESTDHSEQELPIIYLDDDVIVVNKPAGILTHSKGALDDEFTVATFFRRYTTHGLSTNRPGVVHRLDRATSGIMIGARNDAAAAFLKKQFSNRTVKKEYTAVVIGVPKESQAIIDLPIGRNPTKPSTFRVDPNGKEAITRYDVLRAGKHYSLVNLQPKTGRTHQLRVHMQYINTPIAGDKVYGKAKNNLQRMYLHAKSLELTLPSGKHISLDAKTPKQFTDMVKEG